MNFEFTDVQIALQDLVTKFVEKEMPKSAIAKWDADNEFPESLLDKLGELGLMGANIPEEYGGTGGGVMEETIIIEGLARHSSTIAMAYGLGASFGATTLERQGTEAQKQEFLTKIASGELRIALSLTEPGGGTDILGAMKSTAVEDGDDYIINGAKVFTTGLNITPWLFVVARTSRDPKKLSHGLTVFLVNKDTPGISWNKIDKLGSRFLHSYEVVYQDVRVPKSSVIGGVGYGWNAILDTLNNERIFIAATCVGIGQGALDDANQYSLERSAFERQIGQFQAVQHQLAESLTEIELARLMTYKAAWMQDQGLDCSLEATMAKYYASESAFRMTDRGMRILAGFGFTNEYHMQRYYRDIRQFIFAPITNEMCKNYIAQIGCGLPKSY